MFSDGRNAVLLDLRDVRRDTDIGARNGRLLTLRRWCAGSFEPVGLIDKFIVCYGRLVDYLRRLQTMVLREEELVRLDRGYDLSFCLGLPYDHFYLIRNAADWWNKVRFECRKQANLQDCRFLGWHNQEIFALSQSEHGVDYVGGTEVWMQYEANRVCGVRLLSYYAHLTYISMEGTVPERRLVSQIAKKSFSVTQLGAFLHLFRCDELKRLWYELMMVGCEGYGTLLRIPVEIVEAWFGYDILRRIIHRKMDPVLALIAVARFLVGMDWEP